MTLPSATVSSPPFRQSPWLLPSVLLGVSLIALFLGEVAPQWSRLCYFVPYTFLGNSLAPLPYDGAVVYLASHHSVGLIVLIATTATLIIEAWNMEILGRVLARDGTRPFRNHQVTQFSLRWYRKAPFWSLVATCVLPIVPHYPMRILAVLAGYPMWKYQLSVILGRGTRYAGLAAFGLVFPIPGPWIVVGSLVILLIGVRSARRMNRPQSEPMAQPGAATEKV